MVSATIYPIQEVIEEDNRPPKIDLIVKAQDESEVLFKMKRNTKFRKLMNAYCDRCDRQAVVFNSIVFLFDGRQLKEEQTPNELEMEDGDEIDAMIIQTGA